MAQLRQDFAGFEKRHTTIVVVANQLPFVGLPDAKHRVLKLYGQEVKLFKLGRMPAQVLVDIQGIARFVHYGHDMSDIPKNSDVFELIDGLDT
jgi:peroxiredoxin